MNESVLLLVDICLIQREPTLPLCNILRFYDSFTGINDLLRSLCLCSAVNKVVSTT